MSTRANIIIRDGGDKLFFYRHSDGYPDGTLPTLKQFTGLIASGKIRNNLQQSAGWLVLIGAIEYKTLSPEPWKSKVEKEQPYDSDYEVNLGDEPKDWKVGAYEPTTSLHGDIEFMYEIDLVGREITVKKVGYDHGEQQFTAIDVIKF